MLAEYAMPKSKNTSVPRSLLSSMLAQIPSAIGSIIAAVAVFETHIERIAVARQIKIAATPKRPPARAISHIAIFLSSFCICRAVARAKPPKKVKIVGFAKFTSVLLMVAAVKVPSLANLPSPIATASTGTISAVTVICTASVSHIIAIKASNARPFLTLGSNGSAAYSAKPTAAAIAIMMTPRLGNGTVSVSLSKPSSSTSESSGPCKRELRNSTLCSSIDTPFLDLAYDTKMRREFYKFQIKSS